MSVPSFLSPNIITQALHFCQTLEAAAQRLATQAAMEQVAANAAQEARVL
jgi:hypothetical protein